MIEEIIKAGNYNDILAIIKGFRNGAVYGAKIRFPHALVMTFLFRRSDPKTMAKQILQLTYQHSKNLAFFVTIYKSLLLIQRKIKGKEHNPDSFIAGLIGGYIIFGSDNAVNQQIVLYLFSRISTGLARLAHMKGLVPAPDYSFSAFAAVTWGVVMWLFRHNRDSLQGGLQASMQYLYNDSDKFTDLRTLLWHNK
ncbi:Peroxisomal membrane protein 4 [Boothiomyces macroporosus]|uniref:Peroxisomal membrane protein 4 n=1 Tax=Boothiomyces macroporosus TaxID=261099 RepID=A0AAD5UG22_9FUNG|nr:Peroxisomal membrane protein 4 [Boothiomyces macroporosus]KAJ3309954.1 Peroxisomal membrane protein 4 [Boothiomyces sp. JEL0838]